jgi:hypothetical protein
VKFPGRRGYYADESKQKLFLLEEKDFALPRLFFVRDFVSAAQEGAGGMRGGKSGREEEILIC